MISLAFKNGGTSPAFSHRIDSVQEDERVHFLLPAGPLCMSISVPWLCLRHIAVLVRRGLASLNVLLVDEHFDALFDHADTWVEPGFGLIDNLHTQPQETQFAITYENVLYCYW